jgi:GxxExxY protein
LSELGFVDGGMIELIYQRTLAIELRKAGLDFVREQEMPIIYQGEEIGIRRADFMINGAVLLDLKALVKMDDVHLAQGLNYLVAYHLDKGLLINFGASSLEVKRLWLPKRNST